jgi:hypothetical protein
MTPGDPDPASGHPWTAGLRALIGSVLANLVVWAGGNLLFDIPEAFEPLAGPGPTIFLTVVGTIGAVLAFVVVRRVATRPVPVFRMVAAGALLVSFIPDVLLLTEQGAANFPGATVPGVVLLILMHVVAAAIIVRCLEGAR